MLKAYKTEIRPTPQQALTIRQTLGICRYLYNLYLASNFEVYETLAKNNKGDWTIWRHKIQIPTIGIVKLKEKGYLPKKAKVRSGTISYKAGRYYVSILAELPDKDLEKPQSEGIGTCQTVLLSRISTRRRK